MPPPVWSYGVTSVSSRFTTLLPGTLASLRQAGFDQPRLFLDDCSYPSDWLLGLGVPIVCRPSPPVGVAGNWWLSLVELFVRNPKADRYALFQDDLVCVQGLRTYLDSCPYPAKGYWNLFTMRDNEAVIKGKEPGTWHEASELQSGPLYHGKKPQTGRGAVALVFDRNAVIELLSSRHLAERPLDECRGWRMVDGGVCTALNKAGIREYVHCPSLVDHTGMMSTIGHRPEYRGLFPKPNRIARSFPGVEIDAGRWIKAREPERAVLA